MVDEVGSLSLFGLSNNLLAPPAPLFYLPLAFSINKANPICSLPFKLAAAVCPASVENSTNPIPFDLPSGSYKILTLVIVPHLVKKCLTSSSVALYESFLTKTSNDPYG